MNNDINRSRFSARKIAVTGILSALSIALNFTPLGFMLIPGLPVQITFMHIPVIIGAIIEGPFVGAFIGLVFGLTSLYTAVQQSALPIAFAFLNPLVSVVPRILIGIVAHYAFKALNNIFKGKKQAVSIGVSAAAATITNTIGVLGTIYILYAKRYIEALISFLGLPSDTASIYIFVSALPNFIAELISSILLSVPIVLAIKKIKK